MSNDAGRPTVITPAVVSLLVTSFHNGLTVREACWQSGISHEAYYSRLRSDEQFADIMAKAQSDITIAAKKLVAKEVRNGNIQAAKWWLERNTSKETEQPPETDEEGSNHNQKLDDSAATLDRLIALRKTLDADADRGYFA